MPLKTFGSAGHLVKVDTRGLDQREQAILRGLKRPDIPLKLGLLQILRRIQEAWNRMTYISLAGTAKVFRGNVTWAPVNPSYRRKDGTAVWPWGGIPKASGKGLVKGRKRPSGKRVTIGSIMGKDTQASARSLGRDIVTAANRRSVTAFIKPEYFRFFVKKRKVLTPIPSDRAILVEEVRKYLKEVMRQSGGVRRP